MVEQKTLLKLKDKKNLLAFSGGADSTALFFLLLKHNIPFDIAIVDYGIREQSKAEVAYALELATTNNLKCHLLSAPKIEQNFEAKARKIRYDFFEELILKYNYENLLTAHHLGDRFEWMLMQFCKGAGCAEIAGMQKEQNRGFYKLIRPLLHLDKKELLAYLHANKKVYFEDESNLDEDIKRNAFRHNYSLPLLEKYLGGIKKSFEYLDEDRNQLIKDIEIKTVDELAYFKSSHNKRADIFAIDKYLKTKDYMLSANEREALRSSSSAVVGRCFLITQERNFIFIVPYEKEVPKMDEKFKDACRILKIEPKLRPYLYKNREAFQIVTELLTTVS
ncbi:tRNA lysidine(34) synthetase TilS [Sulfurimonas sp. RIFOXYB12_FULL_35_9]|jgi:tRNA(Ile)-lysidine synthase|uniref:tRNA lysidine(34) synthetase TilS n=1 Tax=Sulfurimonas sp. RIFOXYB12_FULL_35_9 TaxID=1802256 RepID=UPI0008AFE7E5|nr:tRNA lysidine(34) synthetase TilS [Sulfurimonas sp. RIFOXYB12_FULL_35_9]MDX9756085.1 tRNA lysidine(34) synthetase TilS [Sulfurimonas sp.]OHE04286.1 MAG: tRNA lysidine(34) synthetase TilS [Sulfurimonas sp. RIFOXYB12_FULL_35_9]